MLLARDLMAFEQDATQHWMQHAHASAEALLRQPLLAEDPHTHRSLQVLLQAYMWMNKVSHGCCSGMLRLHYCQSSHLLAKHM